MEAYLEYKTFDKTFVGIYNTMKQKHNSGKTTHYSRAYTVARDNKAAMIQEKFSKKHPFYEMNFMPPQTSPSMIDGFVTVMLLGETFEILNKIMALSPANGGQSDHISKLMVSNQTADWVSNNSPIG